MPIPGSRFQGMAFEPEAVGDVYYSSLCTFLARTTAQAADGQVTSSYAAIDNEHTDIPCRKSPFVIIRPQMQEAQRHDTQIEDGRFQLNLSRYVSDASVEMQVVVDGVTYEITSVEPDGNNLTTRLGISLITPFNA